jgi:dihydrodipicolinate synthase/N-acetylneuraminate lyase
MNRERGLIAAALTPRGKHGELNFGGGFELIDHLGKAGVPGVALLTAAGEYPAFTVEERTRLVYLGVKRSRVPVLAGVGAEDIATAVALAREALSAGAHGVILPPPLLFSYPDEDLREYYGQFAGQMGKGVEIWIDGAAPAEALMATGLFTGVAGTGLMLSVEANAIPEVMVALDCARRTGDAARQERLNALAAEFAAWSARFAPLVAVKIATETRGIRTGPLPLPIPAERAPLVEEFRGWFKDWLPGAKKVAANV